MKGVRTEEHGAHVGHAREEVHSSVLKHDGRSDGSQQSDR